MPPRSDEEKPSLLFVRFAYQQMVPLKVMLELLANCAKPASVLFEGAGGEEDEEFFTPPADLPWWATVEGQHAVLMEVVQHEECRQWPVKQDYETAFLKGLIKLVENTQKKYCASELGLCDELAEVFVSSLTTAGSTTAAGAHCSAGEGAKDAPTEHCRGGDTMRRDAHEQFFFKTFHYYRDHGKEEAACSASTWLPAPIRVTGDFINVGLSVWPAGVLVTELLHRILFTPSVMSNDDGTGLADNAQVGLLHSLLPSRLKILELGAGVGLTAAPIFNYLAARRGMTNAEESSTSTGKGKGGHRRYSIDSVVLTDYQPVILENCVYNLDLLAHAACSSTSATSVGKAEVQEEEDQPHMAARQEVRDAVQCTLLDWTEAERNASLFSELRPNLILAADVIYDVDVIPDLARTLRQCLELTPDSVVLIISTERNKTTFGLFLQHVEDWCVATSIPGFRRAEGSGAEGDAALIDCCGSSSFWGTGYVNMLELIDVRVLQLKS